jgi:hypothetical protein
MVFKRSSVLLTAAGCERGGQDVVWSAEDVIVDICVGMMCQNR